MEMTMQASPLRGWATIAQVSAALGVKHSTIKHTAQKAFARKQDWVKRELFGSAGTCARWILDTESAAYREHERRWRRHASSPPHTKATPQPPLSGQANAEVEEPTPPLPPDVLAALPDLCDWLADWGLVVFTNALEENPCWQWAWGEEGGTGYASAAAALTAAIQHQMTYGEPCSPAPSRFPPPPPRDAQQGARG